MAERRPKRSPTRECFPFLDKKIQHKCKLIEKPTMITKHILNMKQVAYQCANSKCPPKQKKVKIKIKPKEEALFYITK